MEEERLQEKLGAQGFYTHAKELSEPNRKAVKHACEELLKESNSATNAFQELNEAKL